MGVKKVRTIDDYCKNSIDYIDAKFLIKINGYLITSIKCDERRENWVYTCHRDADGSRAATLNGKRPPIELYRLFGWLKINGTLHCVLKLTFNIAIQFRWKPQELVTIKCRLTTNKLWHPDNFNPNMECEYGQKILNVLHRKFNIEDKPKEEPAV